METLASDSVEPSWMQDERIVVEKIFPFMDADSLPTSRPISIQSTNPNDIFQLFDSITYDKGATLIRMMSMFLGEQNFQNGIRNYLKELSYGSATQEDLWRYLSNAADNQINVEQIMNGWTKQAGYPIVEINREYATPIGRQQQINIGGYMNIKQQPFSLFSTTNKHEKWWIPFKYFDRKSSQVISKNNNNDRVLLKTFIFFLFLNLIEYILSISKKRANINNLYPYKKDKCLMRLSNKY